MPRPCKRRRICAKPNCRHFGPKGVHSGSENKISMTVDEYEAIRLIDFEELTQEECAFQMNISRTTAQSIYASARRKLAESLVNGSDLLIDGGSFFLCGGSESGACMKKKQCPRAAKPPHK